MAHPMGKIMTVMARTESSNTKSSGKRSAGKARSGETKVMDTVEPSPVMGVLTKDRRDIACFVLVILAVLFCASEWFRVVSKSFLCNSSPGKVPRVSSN